MLTDDELATMQDTLTLSLPELATITRPSNPTSDGAGGRTTTPSGVVASAPCRLAPAGLEGRADSVSGDRLTNVQRWQLTFPAGTNVAADDLVTVNARTFTVVSVAAARSYGVSCRVSAIEVL